MKTDHDNIELFILNQAIKNSNSKKEIQELKNEMKDIFDRRHQDGRIDELKINKNSLFFL